MKSTAIFILLSIIASSCNQTKPRKPINIKTTSAFETSVEKNKKRIAKEEAIIKEIIASDTVNTYLSSSNGFWYYYNIIDKTDMYVPLENDLVAITYDIRSIDGDTLYAKEDIGITEYKVDKQDLFPGLQAAVKLMRKGETATFLFPSHQAFGYYGDSKKITSNTPIITTITLIDIIKQHKNPLN